NHGVRGLCRIGCPPGHSSRTIPGGCGVWCALVCTSSVCNDQGYRSVKVSRQVIRSCSYPALARVRSRMDVLVPPQEYNTARRWQNEAGAGTNDSSVMDVSGSGTGGGRCRKDEG